ncbi:MAG: RDD family protein [Elusimicrobia bacterium]|nr:RDD family protein [Elusimicrobiota bacterium]
MELASRKQRLGAALSDGVIVAIPYVIGTVDGIPEPVQVVGVVASVVLLMFQLYLLSTTGQTLGKKIIGIKIVLKDTLENGGFVVNVLKRGLLNGLLCLVPGYFLVDSCFIFREDKRCLHDMIAGTCVVVQ